MYLQRAKYTLFEFSFMVYDVYNGTLNKIIIIIIITITLTEVAKCSVRCHMRFF